LEISLSSVPANGLRLATFLYGTVDSRHGTLGTSKGVVPVWGISKFHELVGSVAKELQVDQLLTRRRAVEHGDEPLVTFASGEGSQLANFASRQDNRFVPSGRQRGPEKGTFYFFIK
jgi:hypothetical protein